MSDDKIALFSSQLGKIFTDLSMNRHNQEWQAYRAGQEPTRSSELQYQAMVMDDKILYALRKSLALVPVTSKMYAALHRYYCRFIAARIELDLRVSKVKQALNSLIHSYTAPISGIPCTFQDLTRLAMIAPDPQRRLEANLGLAGLYRALEPDFRELVQRRNALITDYGFNDYSEFLLSDLGIDRALWRKLSIGFNSLTIDAYERFLDNLRSVLKVPELTFPDLPYALYYQQQGPEPAFIWPKALPILKTTCDKLGVDYQELITESHFREDYDERLPRISFLLKADRKIRVFAQATDGFRFYLNLFQQFGQLWGYLAESGNRHPSPEIESVCFQEAIGLLFATMLWEPEWLEAVSDAGKLTINQILGLRDQRLYQLRSLNAYAEFEQLIYQSQEPFSELYQALHLDFIVIPYQKHCYQPPLPMFINRPGELSHRIMAEFIKAHLCSTVRVKSGTLVTPYTLALIRSSLLNDAADSLWLDRFQNAFNDLTLDGLEGEFVHA